MVVPREALVIWMTVVFSGVLNANGVLRYGFGAGDAGAAGVFAGTGGDALAGLQMNPAVLTAIDGDQWTLSLRGGWLQGRYSRAGVNYDTDVIGGFPEIGLAWRPGNEAVTLGFSLAPIAAAAVDWTYPDAPGGIGGISYGSALSHDSGFVAVRANTGLAWKLGDHWSVGASIGAVYSRVDFDAPFIFQTNSALAGAKVNLDMQTDGWEPMSEFGILWTPSERWGVGLHYRPQVELRSSGEAEVDFSAQLPPLGLAGAPSHATYHANTRNALPSVAGGGLEWRPCPRLKAGLWVDWIGWSRAFDELEVSLQGGSNAAINGVIGANVSDRVPVRWKDTWVVGLGTEWAVSDRFTVRGGWRWGESPVPHAWATPLNASLLEHTLAIGLGWRQDCWRVDMSYEYQFGASAKVLASGYRAGEYSNSKDDFSAHVLGVGLTVAY